MFGSLRIIVHVCIGSTRIRSLCYGLHSLLLYIQHNSTLRFRPLKWPLSIVEQLGDKIISHVLVICTLLQVSTNATQQSPKKSYQARSCFVEFRSRCISCVVADQERRVRRFFVTLHRFFFCKNISVFFVIRIIIYHCLVCCISW